MSNTTGYPVVTIDTLHEKEKGPIWVINNSAATNPPGADLFITVAAAKGNTVTIVKVPRTWLPVNLNEQAPRQDILDSPQFLRAVSSGILRLISAEEAQDKNTNSGAPIERERLVQAENAVKNAALTEGGKAFNDSLERIGANGEVLGSKTSAGSISFDADEGAEEEDEEVSAGFKAWLQKLNNMANVEAAINEVQLRGEFSDLEMHYVVANVKHERIRAGFSKRLKAKA